LDRFVAVGVTTLLRADCSVCVVDRISDVVLVDTVAQRVPDVIIVDESAGVPLVRRLRLLCPLTEILVLAQEPTVGQGIRLLGAGANCVARGASSVNLLETVTLTAQGVRFFTNVDGEFLTRSYPTDAERLTVREHEVLEQLATGASYASAASALGIRRSTVVTHTSRILRKLGKECKRDLEGMSVPLPPGS
jgi:DNA-binding NarL/FixJ family response regulator